VPVIDIGDTSDAGRRRAADDIHKACREIGFFTITNHGVPAKLIAAQFAAAKAFFDLPLDQRMAIHMKNSPATAGYEPIGGQVLDSQDDSTEQAPPDLKESFYCGLELAADHPLSLRPSRCFGHNQWPALPGFREQNLAYYDALSELSARLMHLLALSLDLPENWFDRFHNPAAANLRMIKYPPHPANAAFNQIGAGAHTDWGGVTILAQDDVGGLEVQTADGALDQRHLCLEPPPGEKQQQWSGSLLNPILLWSVPDQRDRGDPNLRRCRASAPLCGLHRG
jgi:isopenicillin N synthase-like dioxygenase